MGNNEIRVVASHENDCEAREVACELQKHGHPVNFGSLLVSVRLTDETTNPREPFLVNEAVADWKLTIEIFEKTFNGGAKVACSNQGKPFSPFYRFIDDETGLIVAGFGSVHEITQASYFEGGEFEVEVLNLNTWGERGHVRTIDLWKGTEDRLPDRLANYWQALMAAKERHEQQSISGQRRWLYYHKDLRY